VIETDETTTFHLIHLRKRHTISLRYSFFGTLMCFRKCTPVTQTYGKLMSTHSNNNNNNSGGEVVPAFHQFTRMHNGLYFHSIDISFYFIRYITLRV